VPELLLAELNSPGKLDLSRAVIDSSHVRALKTAQTGPSPVDRARPGSKHHLIVDAGGVPLAVTLTGGNPQRRHPTDRADRSDPTHPRCSEPPPSTPGAHPRRPRLRPRQIPQARCRRITPIIARRGQPHGSGDA
jgi:hypothetical protein